MQKIEGEIEFFSNLKRGASKEDGIIGKESMINGKGSPWEGETRDRSVQLGPIKSYAQGVSYEDVQEGGDKGQSCWIPRLAIQGELM